MTRLLIVLLAAWAGSLWTICGIVAPSLFRVLNDRTTAGEAAGYFFTITTWLSLALGALALLIHHRTSTGAKTLDRLLLLAATLSPSISEYALRPLMNSARAANEMARFGMLHGISALLFAVAGVSIVVVLWRTARRS